MSFAAGFASTFVPLVNDAIDSRIERNEKQADIAWKTFLENKTLRQKKEAEATRRLQQAQSIARELGYDSGAVPTIYRNLELGADAYDLKRDLARGEMTLEEVSTGGADDTYAALGTGVGSTTAPSGALEITSGTRAQYAPTPGMLNISLDFNASPSGDARGTEVIIPDDASPAVREAAERFNQRVAEFARKNGIQNYPVRGVRTRSENGRGIAHTMHVEPFFNNDVEMQRAIQNNPEEFAAIYKEVFGSLPNARLIAPHGVGNDRGATSPVFGDETTYGQLITQTAARLSDIGGATSGTTTEDDQMDDLFRGNGAARELFDDRVAAAGMSPDDVTFSTTIEDPVAGMEPRYRLTPAVEDKNLPGLGKDPEVYMDWLIQNPNADPETVTIVEKQLARAQQQAGTQMPELTDQKFSIDVEAPDGAADTVEAVLGEDGKFYQLGQNGWQPVAGNIVASRSYDSIGLGSQVTARVQKIDTEFNQKRNAFTDMVTQASGLAGIVNRNEDVLRTAGGPLASFVSKIDGNIEAFINNLSTEDGPVTRNDVETLISSFESDLATSSMSRTARDYAEFKARQLRFAYAFARVTNEQSGVGLSNADLRNAYDTISSGSSRENYLNSLSNQIELSQTRLETAFKTYNKNQAIRNARALPGIDMSPSDFDAYMSDLRSSVDLSWMEQTAGPDQTQPDQENASTETDTSQNDIGTLLEKYNAGQPILVTPELAERFPSLQDKVGQYVDNGKGDQ